MTDRYKGFLVHLDEDMRDDDAEHVINAIKMIKHVGTVEPLISQPQDWIAHQRGACEIKMKIFAALQDEL